MLVIDIILASKEITRWAPQLKLNTEPLTMNQPIELFTSAGRFDKKTITNLIKGKHDPKDRLPYQMLLDCYKGRRYAQALAEAALRFEDPIHVPQAMAFVELHDRVIEALCRHYDESRFQD